MALEDVVQRLAVVGHIDNRNQLFISCREALEAATA
jgi:hypothetical protein